MNIVYEIVSNWEIFLIGTSIVLLVVMTRNDTKPKTSNRKNIKELVFKNKTILDGLLLLVENLTSKVDKTNLSVNQKIHKNSDKAFENFKTITETRFKNVQRNFTQIISKLEMLKQEYEYLKNVIFIPEDDDCSEE